MTDFCSQALNDRAALQERLAHVTDPHVRTLNRFVDELRKTHASVPFFDPCAGGNQACVLLLLSDPGKAGAQATGFASIDNPDKTARNLKRMMAEARLHRRLTVNWNIVPWATVTPLAEI